jgi:hypothetical protein
LNHKLSPECFAPTESNLLNRAVLIPIKVNRETGFLTPAG